MLCEKNLISHDPTFMVVRFTAGVVRIVLFRTKRGLPDAVGQDVVCAEFAFWFREDMDRGLGRNSPPWGHRTKAAKPSDRSNLHSRALRHVTRRGTQHQDNAAGCSFLSRQTTVNKFASFSLASNNLFEFEQDVMKFIKKPLLRIVNFSMRRPRAALPARDPSP